MDKQQSFIKDSAGRSIEDSETEQVIRGPREGFVESIDTNVMLIRKKIKTPSLKIEYVTVGKQTQTKLAIVYLQGVADDALVSEAHNRLSRIEIDGILESSYIESMIEDAPLSPFPTIFNTERPDRLCAGLLEGKVAILTDGTPFALTMPAVFVEFLQSNDDYYNGSFPSSIVRWIRALGLLVALILPAFFVATLTIHQELLQPPFLMRISSNRADLPYPVLIESIFTIITFELLREAGQRMPRLFHGSVITLLGTDYWSNDRTSRFSCTVNGNRHCGCQLNYFYFAELCFSTGDKVLKLTYVIISRLFWLHGHPDRSDSDFNASN